MDTPAEPPVAPPAVTAVDAAPSRADPLPLRWLMVDMNSYFAAVEQQFRPELRGRPVGVLPVETEHTCCIAASAEAKAHGVKTGTRVPDARRLCPGITLVKARPDFYVKVHRDILAAVDTEAPIHEVVSIDEFTVRLGRGQRDDASAAALAKRIKRAIAGGVGERLRCSVGIAPTVLLAKIASNLEKPDGLTVLHARDVTERLADWKLTDLTGVSHGMAARLHRAGVHDVPALWNLSPADARRIWGGEPGLRYWYALHGHDCPPAATHRHSLGHGHVLPGNLRNPRDARGVMVRLLHKAAHRLRHEGYVAHRLVASIRYEPPRHPQRAGSDRRGEAGAVWHDEIALPGCRDTLTIVQHFARLWDRRPPGFCSDHIGRPKKVSVTLTGLEPHASATGSLFQPQAHRDRLGDVFDRVNTRFGPHMLHLAAMHHTRHAMDDKIAFGRVPDEACPM